jgi:carboxyl-terminal processing protease
MQSESPQPTSRLFIWLPFLLSAVLAGGILIGMRLQSAAPPLFIRGEGQAGEVAGGYGKLEELLRYIEAKYVDEVDRDKLVEEAVERLLQQLDPHSSYIPADQLETVEEQMGGSFVGIGIEFMMIEDTLNVIAPLAGGPASLAGMMAGDKITGIDDSIVAGKGLLARDVIRMMRGEKGSRVVLQVLRGKAPVFKVPLTRDVIPMNSLDASFMLGSQIGYIKLNRFSATTHDEFMKALETMHTKYDMQHLVLDLRQNPGGYLQQAVNMLNQLFPVKSTPLVYTEGRAVSRTDYQSTGRILFPLKEIVVLIDEGSASASEIMAGALQDQDRALIIGRRSFGKGLVQEQYEFRDGSALRLTVARYFTPSGRSIQKPYSQYQDAGDAEEPVASLAMPVDSTRYYTRKGRVVFGGGGITPDIVVPVDSSLMLPAWQDLRPHLYPFSFAYSQQLAARFRGMSAAAFRKNFQVREDLLDEFIRYAVAKGFKKDKKVLEGMRPELRRQLKAQLARILYDEAQYYQVLAADDQLIRKAVAVIGQGGLANKK